MKKLIQNVLKTPLFTHNPLYKKLYWWNIKRLIPKLIDRPRRVIVENTNLCNLKCDYCPNPIMKRPKGTMNNELFNKIVDECKEWGVEHLYAFGIGEPLLDKDYQKKVSYAKAQGIPDVHCVTNGVFLDYTPKVDYLGVSINRGQNFWTVVGNIHRIYQQRKRPWIEVRLKPETAHWAKYFKQIADKVDIYINITNWGDVIKGNIPMGIQFPCSDLWSSMFVCWDGRVALCCKDYEAEYFIGDLNHPPYDTLKAIWKDNIALETARKAHLKNDYFGICKDCLSNTHLVNPWWRIEL